MRVLLLMAIGAFFVGGHILYIKAILTCKIETTGTFIKYNVVHSGRGVTYEPVFRYYIEGEEFQGGCLNKMSLSNIQKKFVVDQTYTIYVSNKDPGYCAVTRKVPIVSVVGILVGVMSWVAAILLY